MTGIELICTWNSETLSSIPSPWSRNHVIFNYLKFLALIGTSSEPEVTAQVVGARKQKLNEDFTGKQGNGSKFTAG